jgi:hypothetical protein
VGAINSRRRGSRFEVNAKEVFATRSAALRLDNGSVVRCSYQSVGDEQFNVSPTHTLPLKPTKALFTLPKVARCFFSERM